MEIENKTVVITGASHGLGFELAKLFTCEKAKVIVSDVNGVELYASALELKAHPIDANVANEEDMNHLALEAEAKYGKIDLWINNAGIWMPYCQITDLDLSKVRKMFEVNVFGLMNGSVAALKVMKKNNGGVIVNIISVSALEIHLNSAAYAASKCAADAFTKGIRLETESEGSNIQIISVYPDKMKTRLFDKQKPKNYDEYMETSYVAEKILSNLKKEKPEINLIIRK